MPSLTEGKVIVEGVLRGQAPRRAYPGATMQGGPIDKFMPVVRLVGGHRVPATAARAGSACGSTSRGGKLRICKKCGIDL